MFRIKDQMKAKGIGFGTFCMQALSLVKNRALGERA